MPVGDSNTPIPPRRSVEYSARIRSSWMPYGSCGNAGKVIVSIGVSASAATIAVPTSGFGSEVDATGASRAEGGATGGRSGEARAASASMTAATVEPEAPHARAPARRARRARPTLRPV